MVAKMSLFNQYQLHDEAVGDAVEQVAALDRVPEQVLRDPGPERPGQVGQPPCSAGWS